MVIVVFLALGKILINDLQVRYTQAANFSRKLSHCFSVYSSFWRRLLFKALYGLAARNARLLRERYSFRY
jgi:hypothetical protein